MFDPSETPRIFSLPIGCDFSKAFVNGLRHRLQMRPPHEIANVVIYVNTSRTMRRMQSLFQEHGAGFLPQFKLITSLSNDPLSLCDLPESAPPLRRILQLGQLVRAVLKQDESIAPASMTFDLANSLSALMDELQGEDVPMKNIMDLDITDHSEHWERSKKFLMIIAQHWDQYNLTDKQDRMRHVVKTYAQHWQNSPPKHPILIAGSTGSRGETAAFMKAVSMLPQGAVILPGVDDADPTDVWDNLIKPHATLDHPQAGFSKLLQGFGIDRADVQPWSDDQAYSHARNRLVSLALRPAPITDQWLTEGPKLIPSLAQATKGLSLLEAQSQKEEAMAIATCLRQAVEEKQQAVLITPNRTLTRRVTAQLNRWGIEPDDSAGNPLHLSPPGIFLRVIANCFGQELTPQKLISILKHSLTHTNDRRSEHNLFTQRFEIHCLRGGPPFVDTNTLMPWAKKQKDTASAIVWATWLKQVCQHLQSNREMDLSDWITLHLQVAEFISAGSHSEGSGQLWEKSAGKQAKQALENLRTEQQFGGALSAVEYANLIKNILNDEVRDEVQTAHPLISIWGALEARVQGADLVILGGLNEGVWPEKTNPDVWMNRDMRAQLGLLAPERTIGLSAHDFQQAIGAPKVVLSRGVRDGDSLTNASRWVMRLTNLLQGLGDLGKAALNDMRERGDEIIHISQYLEPQSVNTVPAATRPSPILPEGVGIRKLSVTQIEKLVRNPYDIYAQSVLCLRKLQPLGKQADALERGIAIHDIIEAFTTAIPDELPTDAKQVFLNIAEEVLNETVPWPSAQRLWLARLKESADRFIGGEETRRSMGKILATERTGGIYLDDINFTLSVKADRIDQGLNGLRIYDYKSGATPSKGEMDHFNKQLQLEAVIAEHGGFDDIQTSRIEHLEYIGITAKKNADQIEITPEIIAALKTELHQLISHFNSGENGFTAHDKEQKALHVSDFDHLSRKGEWELSDTPDAKRVP